MSLVTSQLIFFKDSQEWDAFEVLFEFFNKININ